MKFSRMLVFSGLAIAMLGVGAALGWTDKPTLQADQRDTWRKTMQAGNFNDAYQGFRQLALDPDTNPRLVGEDLKQAIQCLQQLNRVNEIDPFREAVVKVHADNWRLLWTAAQTYTWVEHQGFIIAGEFQRGPHRGGGEVANAQQRDRVRALQLMQQALPLVKEDDNKQEAAEFYVALADMLLRFRGHDEAWRLQYLSDLDELPDYEKGWGYYRGQVDGTPVDAEGNPVFHHTPKSWESAATDGERWRWALEQAVETDARQLNRVRLHRANFLHSQFGVQTMAYYGRFFATRASEQNEKDESGTYALHTLSDEETIAKLATGVKRFTLPDEFNFIKLYQQVVEDDAASTGEAAQSQLASIYENRRQYPKAADAWRKSIQKYGDRNHKRERLEQIVGNWGRFEPITTQPSGKEATVEFRFRNGNRVSLEAHAIDVEKLLGDVKDYLRKNPPRLEWDHVNIGNIGYRLVHQDQAKYVGERVAQWELPLEPAENHFDRRVTVKTPLNKAGAYLLTATMADGNVSKIVVWVADTAIIRKTLEGKSYYFVGDAVSGEPVAEADLEFFGFKQEHVRPNNYRVDTKSATAKADAQGQVIKAVNQGDEQFQWLITARTKAGRFAFLGFTHIWGAQYHDAEYKEVKTFTITDRPVYRPGQKVNFKFWVRRAQYDQEDTSQFAHQTFQVEIHDPTGEKIFTKQMTSDAYGGFDGEFELPAGTRLGVYALHVAGYGGGQFRVEEYKKPEFEVSVEAPQEPVMLGEKITATVKAKYYFGSPVTQARVKYKVLRHTHSQRWYPIARWDWLYGRGYWWFAYDYDWYPGWNRWGCQRPIEWWWPKPHVPPEVVAEQEAELDADGTFKIEIDTAIAKAVHPDQDHRYEIVVEVTDQSRRTIVGRGEVLVARKPFEVCVWTNRGYYRAGEVIGASFSARTLDGQPVAGTGEAILLAISYNDKKEPVETEVGRWPVNPNPDGVANLQIKASKAGQYRLKYTLTDGKERSVEGAMLFTIIGEGFDGREFHFNDIELIPDQREYAPGETVKLQVNTDRAGSTVLLFVRPSNSVYLPPQVIRLEGKSQIVELPITKKDMPNIFVEAVTIGDAQVYSTTREVYVPPEDRILGVEVVASADAYKPGQTAKVKVKLTDPQGKPFVGSTVLAIYDKALEYISGGSNVPEIKEFFWKWRRHHHPRTESSLDRTEYNLTLPNKPAMQDTGVFGGSVPEEVGQQEEGEFLGGGMAGFMGGTRMRKSAVARDGMAQAAQAEADFAMGPVLASVPPPMEMASNAMMADKADGDSAGQAPLVEPTVRTNFADTALWKASITTNNDGLAEVELKMPENLTAWRVRAWGMGHGTKVGQGDAEVVTRKEVIVRLQAPRFFVQKDEVVLSANVHNYLSTPKGVRVELELDGTTLKPLDESTLIRTIDIPAGGEARIDWRVKVVEEGTAVVRMKALTSEDSDAMEMRFPVYVHGMLKMESFSGSLRPNENKGQITIRVPEERRPEQTRLEVRYSPTLAGAMVDALPYLVDYPYGCTEQTLNRFLPAVITQQVLIDMNLDLEAIKEKRTNLNAQEIGDDQKRAEGWKRFDRNPVFDKHELDKIVKENVNQLAQMQLADGGWGWFSGWGERSYPHTTAVVVHGLQVARQNDVALPENMLERGVTWLKNYQDEQLRRLKNAETKTEPYKLTADNVDALVYMVLVDADIQNDEMREFLYRDRTKLSVYGMTLLGLALTKQDQPDKLAMVMDNISQYLVQDDENQTAYLNLPNDWWWYWYGSEIEAHAYYLKLLTRTNPQSEVAPRLVKYLLNNRKHATYWNSTRDTALVIEAMADYLKATGEHKPDLVVEAWIDGKKQKEVQITAENLFTFDNRFVLEGAEVKSGVHTVELRKRGEGPLYYNAYLTNFTLEDPITAAGLEIKVERNYYRLKPVDKSIKVAGSRGQAVDHRVEKYEREPLVNLATLESGDLVEIELVVESKNDYEYIIFEDMKAAGFEPVEVRSGYTGNAMGAYVEFRDNRVAMFVHRLARGKHSIAYRVRAEIPGRFSALPAKVSAMYAPELKANSNELKLNIIDAEPADEAPAEK